MINDMLTKKTGNRGHDSTSDHQQKVLDGIIEDTRGSALVIGTGKEIQTIGVKSVEPFNANLLKKR